MAGKLLLPEFLHRHRKNLIAFAFPLIGLLLILFAPWITDYASLLVGGAMLALGLVMLIHAIREKEYASIETYNTAVAVTLILCGAIVLLKKDDCIDLLGTTWGLYGIVFGVEDINEVIYLFHHRKKPWFAAFEALLTLVLSVLLIWNPVHSFTAHLRLLGVEMLVAAIRPEHLMKQHEETA